MDGCMGRDGVVGMVGIDEARGSLGSCSLAVDLLDPVDGVVTLVATTARGASLSSVDVVAMDAVTSEAFALAVPCHHCLGTGKYGWSPCHFCHGCVDGYMGRDDVVGMVGIDEARGSLGSCGLAVDLDAVQSAFFTPTGLASIDTDVNACVQDAHAAFLAQLRALLASRGGDGTQDGAG